MASGAVAAIIGFYEGVFHAIFTDAFSPGIEDPFKAKDVRRRVEESADAASQALVRFARNQRLSDEEVQCLLEGLGELRTLIRWEDISNPNVTPEEVVEKVLPKMGCGGGSESKIQVAVFRQTLHSIVQVLMLVGPVMAEWRRIGFARTFEVPRRVVESLNQISEQMNALGHGEEGAADDRYELMYRDYLLQRFHRVEAGTVRMAANLAVDLRELFVMPRAEKRAWWNAMGGADERAALMDLAAADQFMKRQEAGEKKREALERGWPLLDMVKVLRRSVIVGLPGAGKSTFLEWLQLKVASVDVQWVLGDQQAIPILVRLRQLDPTKLPTGAALIQSATASAEQVALMPAGWLERQMSTGRVLFMVDGLDEVSAAERDEKVLPWLMGLVERFPKCAYLLSSRPVGYPPGSLNELEFEELAMLDFEAVQVREYAVHWCTAVRLARHEPEEEARREGQNDGEAIVKGFEGNQYISDLARSPLMLSAICLVVYFEEGKLPKDRALLYRLCVEGLLHHWDRRRGIRSEYALEEKLAICREVALQMQLTDRAEIEATDLLAIVTEVLQDEERAMKLVDHIRIRTGLLLERRPGVFAFAHLTFQEYLAACAIDRGNEISIQQCVTEIYERRWREVIPLYCAIARSADARRVLRSLLRRKDLEFHASLVADAFHSSSREINDDVHLRQRTIDRLAGLRMIHTDQSCCLDGFASADVARIANGKLGSSTPSDASHAWLWLQRHPGHVDVQLLLKHLRRFRRLPSVRLAEILMVLCECAPDQNLAAIADEEIFSRKFSLGPVALGATGGFAVRASFGGPAEQRILLWSLRALANDASDSVGWALSRFLVNQKHPVPADRSARIEISSLLASLLPRLNQTDKAVAGKSLKAWLRKLHGR
jgi:hypothetical protein